VGGEPIKPELRGHNKGSQGLVWSRPDGKEVPEWGLKKYMEGVQRNIIDG